MNSLVYDQKCIAIFKTTKQEERLVKESKRMLLKITLDMKTIKIHSLIINRCIIK